MMPGTGTLMRAVRSKGCWTRLYGRRILVDLSMGHQRNGLHVLEECWPLMRLFFYTFSSSLCFSATLKKLLFPSFLAFLFDIGMRGRGQLKAP